MSYPSQNKLGTKSKVFKPFEFSNSGLYSCGVSDARLRQFEQNLGGQSAKVSGVTQTSTNKSSPEENFTKMDRANQVQKVLSLGQDYSKLVSDSTSLVDKMNLLITKSSQTVTVTQTVKITQLTQLAIFIDDTTVLIISEFRVLQQTRIFSNIDEVRKSIDSLNSMLNSRLKRFGSLLAECLAALGRATAAFSESNKVKFLQTQLAALVNKVPRLQALFTRGISLISKALSAIGIAIGAYQAYDKWQDYREKRSPENLRKAIVETIAFVVGVVSLVIAAFLGGTGAIVIGVGLLIYGLVDAYFGFKDPTHQDFIAQGIYSINADFFNTKGRELFALIEPYLEKVTYLGESFEWAIQKNNNSMHELSQRISRAASDLTEHAKSFAVETFDDFLLGIRDTFITHPGL